MIFRSHLKAAAEAAKMSDADLAAALAEIDGRTDLNTCQVAMLDEASRRRSDAAHVGRADGPSKPKQGEY